jgi:hypothetical protein
MTIANRIGERNRFSLHNAFRPGVNPRIEYREMRVIARMIHASITRV